MLRIYFFIRVLRLSLPSRSRSEPKSEEEVVLDEPVAPVVERVFEVAAGLFGLLVFGFDFFLFFLFRFDLPVRFLFWCSALLDGLLVGEAAATTFLPVDLKRKAASSRRVGRAKTSSMQPTVSHMYGGSSGGGGGTGGEVGKCSLSYASLSSSSVASSWSTA